MASAPTSLHSFTGGFFFNRRVRRILDLAGYQITFGLPKRGQGAVAVWGNSPHSWRGRLVARKRDAEIITVEDAFLRSVLTGRSGAPPLGLVIDRKGVYFDCTHPSELEDILNFAELEEPVLAARAEAALARFCASGLSKYNGFDPLLEVGEDGYVLVVDQTRGDASIRLGGASKESFADMLARARQENPDALILIKSHPETVARHRQGHFKATDLDQNMRLITAPFSPKVLFDGAKKIYCVTSLMGFEAILHGHRPRLFGKPFYGGWGLSDDEQAFQRRQRSLTPEGLFAGAMLLYPVWYDPYRDCRCDFETALEGLEAQARAWHEDCHGYVALGMRLWKRRHLRQFFKGAGNRFSFEDEVTKSARSGRRGLIWAGKETAALGEAFAREDNPLLRVEDGFLRSRGLGAELVPPMSLVVDDLGIYYDPGRESRLERLLNDAGSLSTAELARTEALLARLIETGVSKYNTGERDPLPEAEGKRRRILVPGQVEDDASILLGAGEVRRNVDLLKRVRADNPDAFIVYKPHPDCEAGLREGGLDDDEALKFADQILHGCDAVAAIMACDEVWTITSLLGFEALLRGKAVTCLGQPFYAGWGLTRDFGGAIARRKVKPSLAALVHAVLIAYPRYFDPVSGLACPVEVVVDRLADGAAYHPGRANRALAKLQGVFASFAPLWR